MRLFQILCVVVVTLSLLGATSAVAAHLCACANHEQKVGQKAEMPMDCHKETAKSEQKHEKKTCCCDKMMGCKVSFNAVGASGEGVVASTASVHYAALLQLLHSQDLTPSPQPPKA